MTTGRIVPVVLLLGLAVPAAALAQPVAHTVEALKARVETGDVVYVMDREGREVRGPLMAISDTALVLSILDQRHEVPFDRVARIDRDGDSLWSGFAIGAGIGVGVGALASQTWAAECDCAAEGVTFSALFYGGIGALFDWAHKGRTHLYSAPLEKTVALAPVVSSRTRGLALSIRW
jgi:hypothetical protein